MGNTHREFRSNATHCENRAMKSSCNETRAAWIMMAESWTALIPHGLVREWERTPSPYARRKARSKSLSQ